MKDRSISVTMFNPSSSYLTLTSRKTAGLPLRVYSVSLGQKVGSVAAYLPTTYIVARQKMKELDRYLATFSAVTFKLMSNSASSRACDLNSHPQLAAAILALPHTHHLEDTESSRLSSFSPSNGLQRTQRQHSRLR
jgi:hypothetical protein